MAECAYLPVQRFEDWTKAHEREHGLAAKAIEEARRNVDYRLGTMNEVREQIDSERGTFQTKAEAELQLIRVHDRLGKLEQDMSATRSETRTWFVAIGFFFTIVSISVAVVSVVASVVLRFVGR